MTIASELTDLVAPLGEAFASPERAESTLRDLGILATPLTTLELPAGLVDLTNAVESAVRSLSALDDQPSGAARLVAALEATRAVFDAIRALEAVSESDTQSLSGPFATVEVWQALAARLPGWLLESWLRAGHPGGPRAAGSLWRMDRLGRGRRARHRRRRGLHRQFGRPHGAGRCRRPHRG